MKMCVGAGSKLIVECAAEVGVEQIVASRRQVNADGGYTGLTQDALVELVDGRCDVVRDHGGPHQNGEADDDWAAELHQDVTAGFDGLHLDVSKLPKDDQVHELRQLAVTFRDEEVFLEYGGERDPWEWTRHLAWSAGGTAVPRFVVVDLGGHIWNDKQVGYLTVPDDKRLLDKIVWLEQRGVMAKAHNMDWVGRRDRWDDMLDAVNIAPEFGNVEIDAWLRAVSGRDAADLLNLGYTSKRWTRWFGEGEGTNVERARAGLRYVLASDEVRGIIGRYDGLRDIVKSEVKDAIITG